MVEIDSTTDLLITRQRMDAWLGDIKSFPREKVIGKDGSNVFCEGWTIKIVDPEDLEKKIVYFASPQGILIVEQNEIGITDLRSAIVAEDADYALYGKIVRKAVVERQRLLSWGNPTLIDADL
jgi:hypothetical protein